MLRTDYALATVDCSMYAGEFPSPWFLRISETGSSRGVGGRRWQPIGLLLLRRQANQSKYVSVAAANVDADVHCDTHICMLVTAICTDRLAVLPSPKPLIEQCPLGSVLVKAKYASVCGSDMPYFKAKSLMAPSSYWVTRAQTTTLRYMRCCKCDPMVSSAFL